MSAGDMTSNQRPKQPSRSLADTVERLHAEIEGLHRALRHRAVIEQAKGLLAGRLGCTTDEAFDQLAAMSQRANIKVVEVAAGLLGLSVPIPATDPSSLDDDTTNHHRRAPQSLGAPARGGADPFAAAPDTPVGVPSMPEQATARYHLTCAAISTVRDGNDLAQVLWDNGLRHLGVSAVLLAVLEPDDAVRLVGAYGLPARLVSAWQRVPSSLNLAFLRAVSDNRPLWLSRDEATRSGYDLLGDGEMRGCIPLHYHGRIFGVASVTWPQPVELDTVTRTYVTALLYAAGRRLADLLHRGDDSQVASPAAYWIDAVLEALPESFALVSPVRDSAGAVVDWRIDRCSPETADVAGRPPSELVGRRLTQLYPHLVEDDILQQYEHALGSGTPFSYEADLRTVGGQPGRIAGTFTVRGARLGDAILLHWRNTDVERREHQRLARLELLDDLGWAEWDMRTGDAEWSPSTYRILQREPRQGPLKLGALRRYAAPADVSRVEEAVRRLTRRHRRVDITVSVRRHGSDFPVRLVADPIVDRAGRLVAVHAVLRRLPEGQTTPAFDASAPREETCPNTK